jgi:hypothetical protein
VVIIGANLWTPKLLLVIRKLRTGGLVLSCQLATGGHLTYNYLPVLTRRVSACTDPQGECLC